MVIRSGHPVSRVGDGIHSVAHHIVGGASLRSCKHSSTPGVPKGKVDHWSQYLRTPPNLSIIESCFDLVFVELWWGVFGPSWTCSKYCLFWSTGGSQPDARVSLIGWFWRSTTLFQNSFGGPILPSGKRLHNYGKSPFLMGKSTITMAIFNSYVSLPEGSLRTNTSNWRWTEIKGNQENESRDPRHRVTVAVDQEHKMVIWVWVNTYRL